MLAKFQFLLLVFASIFFLTFYQEKPLSQIFKSDSVLDKITFDISATSQEGSSEPPDSLRYLSYEFCIPAKDKFLEEVKAIDPTIMFHAHSRGRIGCQTNQYLCIGNIQGTQWSEILISIAKLDYVERIDRFYGE
ncbi:MAG: hypothetical protein AB4206_01995 [Xenococcaceae cyanobacterium]